MLRTVLRGPVLLLSGLALIPGSPVEAQEVPRFQVDLEAGPVWQSRNNVQIPNDDSGTRFSLKDLVGGGPWFAGRLYLTWNVNQRHGIRILLAPLTVEESGSITSCRAPSPTRVVNSVQFVRTRQSQRSTA